MESYLLVTEAEASAYAFMKTDLDFKNDRQLLNYIKVKAINRFNPNNTKLGLAKA